MQTIADRIRWILQDQKLSERELSRRSWLTESHIGLLLKKLAQDPGAIEWGTLRDIAWGARVDESWLASGRGTPAPVERPLDTVGQRFRAIVEERGLPIASLDALLKVPRGFSRALGRDQLVDTVDLPTAERLCKTLNCAPVWLLTGKGDRDAVTTTESIEEMMLRVANEHPAWGATLRKALARVRVSADVIRFFADGGGKKPGATVDELVEALLAKQRQVNQEDEARARRDARTHAEAHPTSPKPPPAAERNRPKTKRRAG